MSINVFEIRNYLLQPHLRDHFISYFESNFVHTLTAANMHVLGQSRLIGEPDHFVWIRGYSDMHTRLDSLHMFYDGPVWKKHRTLTNSMIIDSDNVHLLRPLATNPDLTAGRTSATVAASIAESTVSLAADMIAVDFYQAASGQHQSLVDAFQAQVVPAYAAAGIQLRGCFVAEMGENTFPRHPAIQNEHELVVITAYASEAAGRDQRNSVSASVERAIGSYLAAPPETLLLTPTLRSPLRYMPAG